MNILTILSFIIIICMGYVIYSYRELSCKKCLEKRLSVLGENHHDTLISQITLADIYYNRGVRLQDAEVLFKKCFEKSKLLLIHGHPNIEKAFSGLLRCYVAQGKDTTDLIKSFF